MIKNTSFFVCIMFLASCRMDKKCDDTVYNCKVSLISFDKIDATTNIDSLYRLLGEPYFYLPEDPRPFLGNMGRFGWKKGNESDRSDNAFIIIEVKNGVVASKELQVWKKGDVTRTRKKY